MMVSLADNRNVATLPLAGPKPATGAMSGPVSIARRMPVKHKHAPDANQRGIVRSFTAAGPSKHAITPPGKGTKGATEEELARIKQLRDLLSSVDNKV